MSTFLSGEAASLLALYFAMPLGLIWLTEVWLYTLTFMST